MERYLFGNPIATDAVLEDVPLGRDFRPLRMEEKEGKGLLFSLPVEERTKVYGLGEALGRMDKRGRVYVSFNTDSADMSESRRTTYCSHNFFLIDGEEKVGFFFDAPGKVVFDFRAQDGKLSIETPEDLRLYVIRGSDLNGIAHEFLRSIGRGYVPPLWAFGFGQSRFGYRWGSRIRKVVRNYQRKNLPLDYVCLDIDHMDHLQDFSFSQRRFPRPEKLIAEMKEKGIHLVPIVDAGISGERNNALSREGKEKGYFVRKEDGEVFTAIVWPGRAHFPDFFRPEVRTWFGNLYSFYTEKGITGFWNDMNEPAIFKSKLYPDDREGWFEGISGLPCYRSFVHEVDGRKVNHYDVHNLYGTLMTRAASQALQRNLPERFLLFGRSSYVGGHRDAGLWTGDNSSCYEHIRLLFSQLPGLSLCGFFFVGADTGGFLGNADGSLLLRFLQLSTFTPLFRNHTAIFTRHQECYRYGRTKAFQNILHFRYRFLPFLYTAYLRSTLSFTPLFRPLSFLFSDETSRNVEDELMLGENVLLAPIFEEGQRERKVYLPEPMFLVRYRDEEFRLEEWEQGFHVLSYPEEDVCFFLRHRTLLPVLRKKVSNTREVDMTDLELLGDGAEGEVYRDDGRTKEVSERFFVRVRRKEAS